MKLKKYKKRKIIWFSLVHLTLGCRIDVTAAQVYL